LLKRIAIRPFFFFYFSINGITVLYSVFAATLNAFHPLLLVETLPASACPINKIEKIDLRGFRPIAMEHSENWANYSRVIVRRFISVWCVDRGTDRGPFLFRFCSARE
jgi:hypothetical protein